MADVEPAGLIAAEDERALLRFITCGSVDDGKSTLIGRLLHDAHAVFADQLETLEADSRRVGTQGDAIDYALLVDGLAAEREQGITIDVAHRYFSTPVRSFIVADTPGHEQYTRNMATAASNADLAVILVDARKGVLTQTRRHSHIVRLMGVRQVVLAVNKMDLVGHDRATFERIVADYRAFADELELPQVTAIPVSGLNGDNVTRLSERMDWYDGPTLLGHLEAVPVDLDADQTLPFALPVQWVNRPSADFRGFSGLIASGRVRPGDPVRVVPSGRTSRVARVVTADGDLEDAVAGQSVTLTLTDEVDVSRGAVIAAADGAPEAADRFEVTIVWMADDALLPGRRYWLKLGTELVGATVPVLRHAIDVNTRAEHPVETLGLNDIAVGEVQTERPIAFRRFEEGAALGGFILIDTVTNATLGAGTIGRALRRAGHVHWQALEIGREAHAAQKGQRPRVLWFTGLSGSGKSTIANLVEKKLHALGRHSFLLDGDNVRHGLNRDLGFTDIDRVENVRRVGEVARLMADAGLIVLTAFISPFRAERDMVRALLPEGEFVEIFVDTPLGVAEARDVKGLYAKARAGALPDFTGIDSPYEPPDRPDIRIDTTRETAEAAAERIVAEIVGVWAPTL